MEDVLVGADGIGYAQRWRFRSWPSFVGPYLVTAAVVITSLTVGEGSSPRPTLDKLHPNGCSRLCIKIGSAVVTTNKRNSNLLPAYAGTV